MDDFIRVVKKHYPDKKISKAYTWNTLRVDGNIAKLVTWDIDDPSDIERAKNAFNVERKIYSMLPSWWGIRLVDSFEDDNNFVILTNELKHCAWKSVPNIDKTSVFSDIQKQLDWLHSNKILHDDIELKNILLSCDGKHATIIDFEKSRFNPTPQEMQTERELIKSRFEEFARSRGASRRRKRTTRKTRKRRH
jgi:serine/threonine protein kinase